jgi:hypothetical protein
MSRMLRGPSRGGEALFENVEEFVRFYTPSTEPLPKGAYLTLPGYRSPATNPPRPHLPAYDVDNEVEFELDPHPTGSQSPAPSVPPVDPLMKSLPFREVGDQATPAEPDSPRLDDCPPIPSKFDRIDREPESPKEVSQQATRTNPMGDQRVSPREFPGLQVDTALPLTLQECLRRTNAVSLIQI